jgi:hypothetical protein
MGHACSSVICTLKLCLVLGVCPASACGLALKQLAAGILAWSAAHFAPLVSLVGVHQVHLFALDLGSGRDTR